MSRRADRYERLKQGKRAPKRKCSEVDCQEPFYGKALCEKHLSRLRRNGHTRLVRGYGPGTPGAGSITDDGYRIVQPYGNGRRILEHRYVMEQILGRKLHSHETVHHKNGNRCDNRPENLELWSSSHPYGQRVADKVKWAKEILDLYHEVS